MKPTIDAQNYYAIIPEWVLYADITASAVRIYGVLRRHADKASGKCHPSRKTIAKEARCSEKTVDNALKELIDIGAISYKRRMTAEGDFTSNQYTVNSLPQVGEILPHGGVKNDPTGGVKNDAQTTVSMNQSQSNHNAAFAVVGSLWDHAREKTGKPPLSPPFPGMLKIARRAIDAGYEMERVEECLISLWDRGQPLTANNLDKELTGRAWVPKTRTQADTAYDAIRRAAELARGDQ